MVNNIIEYHSGKGLEFEFNGLESWGDFDLIYSVLVEKLQCEVVDKYDGPYSRYCEFRKEGIHFRLMNHPEIGNSLCSIIQDEASNNFLRQLTQLALIALGANQ
ncbi:MAG: hypothetical protein PHH28_16420 [Desulfuromonadaceae bacterium]|nr:hypothetical protein [Desulfuromonadaceae bacterium]